MRLTKSSPPATAVFEVSIHDTAPAASSTASIAARAHDDVVEGHVAGRSTAAAPAATAWAEPGRRVDRAAVGGLVVHALQIAGGRRRSGFAARSTWARCRSRDLELVENGVGGHE